MLVLLVPSITLTAEKDDTAKVLETYKPVVDKGLKWLVKQQHKDGHWEDKDGNYNITMTALAGLALLSEGSTTRDGTYAEPLRKAVAWMIACAQDNGQFIDRTEKLKRPDYWQSTMNQGHGVFFLSQVYAREADDKSRREIGKVLEKAMVYAKENQTRSGGWGAVANDFDDGLSTQIMMLGVFACRKAGVAVPREVIASSLKYLRNSTSPVQEQKAGIVYSSKTGGAPRPELTAAAIALVLNAGEEKETPTVHWLNYVESAAPFDREKVATRWGHDEFRQFVYAQACYQLGEDRDAQLRPDRAKAEQEQKDKQVLLKWSRHREVQFKWIKDTQWFEGYWRAGYFGDVYPSAVNLVILQLDKGNLPFCKR
jgi:hypothetical protein